MDLEFNTLYFSHVHGTFVHNFGLLLVKEHYFYILPVSVQTD